MTIATWLLMLLCAMGAGSSLATTHHDKAGNRTLVRDGKGNETTFAYDLLNRVTLEHFANGDETSYTYNAIQKLTRTDAAGTTTYTYDARDRLLTVDLPAGADRTYAYDDAGQLLSVTEAGHAAANVSYTYDLGGRMLSETSRGKTHTHTYDAAGNRTSTTYDTGTARSETRTYDAFNRITELAEGGRTTGWHYDLAGRAIALTLGNGQQQDNHYDATGKLTARHLFNPNQTLIATFQWQHDAVGNVTSQTERWLGDPARSVELRTTTMVYDDVYRLLGETVVQSGEITKETLYTYDNASNRASKVEKENGNVVKDITYTYNAGNQLTAWSEANGAAEPLRSAAMTYDTRGNRASTAITTHGTEPTTATTTYAWTAQNMLASVTLPDSSVHSYGYDYRVRRVTRSEPGGNPVAMTFSGGLSVAEFEVLDSQQNTLNSQPSVEYQRGPDMGGGVGGLLYSLRSGTAKFNLSNGRGDVVAQSDTTGSLTWTASYEAYGKRPIETGSNADRQRANTKEEDPTGLNNEGFRYRELETGTWMSRDPAGFVDGPNLYAYVRQNPWSKFDPTGLITATPAEARQIHATHKAHIDADYAERSLIEKLVSNIFGVHAWMHRANDQALENALATSQYEVRKDIQAEMIAEHGVKQVTIQAAIVATAAAGANALTAPEIPESPPPSEISPEKTQRDVVRENKANGDRRETSVQQELEQENPGKVVQRERMLRDSGGNKVIDPLTQEGRRVDHAVIDRENNTAKTIETTGPNVDKKLQLEKEQRIREQGGTYIRDKETKKLVPVEGVSEVRRKD